MLHTKTLNLVKEVKDGDISPNELIKIAEIVHDGTKSLEKINNKLNLNEMIENEKEAKKIMVNKNKEEVLKKCDELNKELE